MRVDLSLLAVVLLGCPKKGVERDREMRTLLEQADAAWEDRGTVGLEAASAPLADAWARDPHHVGVAWRLARQRIAEGLVAEDDDLARAPFADARGLGLGCLGQDPMFAEQRAMADWTVSFEGLTVAQQRCAAWGALGWARWMEAMGGWGASLDLDAVDALVNASVASDDAVTTAIGTWAQALVAAMRPPWAGAHPAAAREAFERAIELAPDALVIQADLYLLFLDPHGDPEADALRARITSATAGTPEDEAAQARVAGTSRAGAADCDRLALPDCPEEETPRDPGDRP